MMKNRLAAESLALLYIVVGSGNGSGVSRPCVWPWSNEWLGLSSCEFGAGDTVKTLGPGCWLVNLKVADEARAMYIARLLRHSFQSSVRSDQKDSLSIGVVVNSNVEADLSGCLLAAKKLAFTANYGDGNKILFRDYRCSGSSQV